MEISILDTGIRSAMDNMSLDKNLLKTLDPNGRPLLHLYRWSQDSLTYGHFAKPEILLDFEGLKKHKIEIAPRVTGGGVTLHFTDLAFSFLMPKHHPLFSENVLENYAFVNRVVSEALSEFLGEKNCEFYRPDEKMKRNESFFFCMAKPTRYDVMVRGRKIGGAAQRKTDRGYLHHGTLSLAKPDSKILKDILKDKENVYHAIEQNTFYLLENHLQTKKLSSLRKSLEKELILAFQNALI